MSVPYSFLSGTWIDLGCNLSFEGSLVMKAGQEGCVPTRPCSGAGAVPGDLDTSLPQCASWLPPRSTLGMEAPGNLVQMRFQFRGLGTGPERLLGRFVLQLCRRPHWMARMGCSVIRNINNLDQPRCQQWACLVTWQRGMGTILPSSHFISRDLLSTSCVLDP